MKKFFFAILTAITLLIAMPSKIYAEELNPINCEAIVNLLSQQLPMEAGDGVTWTKIALEDDKTVLAFVFKIDETKLGSDLPSVKSEFDSLTNNQVRQFLGQEFIDMLKSFDKKGRLTVVFSDNTQRTYDID